MNLTAKIRQILFRLDKQGINYVLLRNFESIAKKSLYNEKDIDILIPSEDKKKVKEIMQKFYFKQLRICPAAGHQGFAGSIDGRIVSFHYHIGGVSGAHIPYLDDLSLLSRKVKTNGVFIPSSEDQLLILLLHALLDCASIKNKYNKKINQLLKNKLDLDYIHTKISKISNPAFSNKIIKYLKNKNKKRLEKIRKPLRKTFCYGDFSRMIILVKANLIRAVWMSARLFQNSPLISFIGMDGSGKSTITNLLKEQLDNSLITNSLIYTGRGRNNLLPIQFFGKRYKKMENKIKTAKKIKKKKKRDKIPLIKKIIFTLAAPVFAFDLFLRYWLVIWPKRKTKQIVITDRYSSDVLLMANVPMLFKKIMYVFFPKPSLTVYLYNDSRVLRRRKKDHPLEDLKRQQKIFRQINKKIKPVSIKSECIKKTFDRIVKYTFKLF